MSKITHYAEYLTNYAEYRHTDCRYAECRGAIKSLLIGEEREKRECFLCFCFSRKKEITERPDHLAPTAADRGRVHNTIFSS